ncbi:aminotransferase [Parasutterella secunda]|uniref:aminotransferase n=1 Tax=Parasutterella secunda TaxID=626947 RepID=UPI0025A47AE3|nr:aminotransferase [Parasutterella secunda]MDM8227452.1 aminotransferase [Parasutterella secunda]
MKIEVFGVEQWMNEWETKCAYNVAETCVESITVKELLQMAGVTPEQMTQDLMSKKLTYGWIEGSAKVRELIAGLYQKQSAANVVTTHGCIGANMLIHETLVEPGDHVISVIPTYQQHYSIPESFGANIETLRLKPENGFLPDLNELRAMVKPDTKLICINNPNNPTGALMDEAMLREICDIARTVDAWLLCDEVYRGLTQSEEYSHSVADLYEKGISTGSMSKVFSLAGLRFGWIAAPKELIAEVLYHRDYNTISVGMLDEYFAELALGAKDKILERNRAIIRENLQILDDWVKTTPRVSYVKPKAGTTAFVHIDTKLTSHEFCERLVKEKGVMFTPGSALHTEGFVRIGYANNKEVLKKGLELTSEFLKEVP